MNTRMQHQISLPEAIELTSSFRLNPGGDMPLSETFTKASVTKMLEQPGAESFRIYYARKKDNNICSVLVAADINGHDILPAMQTNQLTNSDEGIILEDAFHCPPACPPPSPLNG